MAIVEDFDPGKYLQAKKRYCPRYFNGHRGFNIPVQVVDITKLTYIPREIGKTYIKHHLINPLVVCKITPERWQGEKIGNIPYRNPNTIIRTNEDGFIYVASRGCKRIMSMIENGYQFVDAYVLEDMQTCFELGTQLVNEYNESL
jgi:hypothetical protein